MMAMTSTDPMEYKPEDMDEHFSIHSDAEANWALRKMKKAQEEADRYIMTCREEISRLEIEINMASKNASRTKEYFQMVLNEYFERLPEDALQQTKTSTRYKLPYGTLIRKKPKTVWEHDDETLAAWLNEYGYGDYLKVKLTPKWADLRKVLDAGGGLLGDEIPDGVTQVTKPEEFEVQQI